MVCEVFISTGKTKQSEKKEYQIRNWQHMFRVLWLVVLAVVALPLLVAWLDIDSYTDFQSCLGCQNKLRIGDDYAGHGACGFLCVTAFLPQRKILQ